MSDEVKPKMWLFRGEVRAPKAGEWVIAREYPSDKTPWLIRDEHDWCDEKVPILEPISPDTVMVPRDRILILEQCVTRRSNGNILTHIEGLTDLLDACWSIVGCAGGIVEPQDEILEALRFAEANMDAHHRSEGARLVEKAITARESELKARKA